MNYQSQEYWQARLSADFSLSGTGHLGFSKRYNRYMYMLKERALDKALSRRKIKIEGNKVLDIGCGSGFFTQYYLQKKAEMVVGVDITEVSVNALRKIYPSQRFYKFDISSDVLSIEEKFDIINVFDVLYHIVDEDRFRRAIFNIQQYCKQGSWILITDSFNPGLSDSAHVKYRQLKEYADILAKHDIDIIEVVPIFHLMGRSMSGSIKDNFMRRLSAKFIESMAGVIYYLDKIYCPLQSSILKLLICRKK